MYNAISGVMRIIFRTLLLIDNIIMHSEFRWSRPPPLTAMGGGGGHGILRCAINERKSCLKICLDLPGSPNMPKFKFVKSVLILDNKPSVWLIFVQCDQTFFMSSVILKLIFNCFYMVYGIWWTTYVTILHGSDIQPYNREEFFAVGGWGAKS